MISLLIARREIMLTVPVSMLTVPVSMFRGGIVQNYKLNKFLSLICPHSTNLIQRGTVATIGNQRRPNHSSFTAVTDAA